LDSSITIFQQHPFVDLLQFLLLTTNHIITGEKKRGEILSFFMIVYIVKYI
jgi:hypothetical protein